MLLGHNTPNKQPIFMPGHKDPAVVARAQHPKKQSLFYAMS